MAHPIATCIKVIANNDQTKFSGRVDDCPGLEELA
jgi:hypothetical protein